VILAYKQGHYRHDPPANNQENTATITDHTNSICLEPDDYIKDDICITKLSKETSSSEPAEQLAVPRNMSMQSCKLYKVYSTMYRLQNNEYCMVYCTKYNASARLKYKKRSVGFWLYNFFEVRRCSGRGRGRCGGGGLIKPKQFCWSWPHGIPFRGGGLSLKVVLCRGGGEQRSHRIFMMILLNLSQEILKRDR
jgi:hypothetical protein